MSASQIVRTARRPALVSREQKWDPGDCDFRAARRVRPETGIHPTL